MKRNAKKALRNLATGSLVVMVAVAMSGLLVVREASAVMSAKSDTMSRLQDNTASNHTIKFTTSAGVAAGQTMTFTFPAGFTIGSVAFGDIDVKDDSTELTLAAVASGTTWGASFTGQVLTITSGTGVIDAGSVVEVEIGTNATGGTNQITNPDVASDTTYEIAIGGTMADSGQLEVQILMDDTVHITAAVDESISFAISDVEIGFGDLNSGTGRWATADAVGANASATTPTAAHTLAVGTNAAGGWAITYSGATLTSGANTITDAATINDDSDGTPGSEQFGISASTDGNSTIASGYARAVSSDWDFVPSVTTTLASETVPSATETISVSYLANISTLTESGNYSTDITYIATASF